jgi:hypothetical protein
MQCGLNDLLSVEVGKIDDEGSDLLLNSDRGAGGVVASKEVAVAGRKGSGGAWGSTSRNAGLAGPAGSGKRPPLRILAKKSQKVDRRAVGCNLVVLKSALPQANYKIQAPNPATPVRAIQGVFSL